MSVLVVYFRSADLAAAVQAVDQLGQLHLANHAHARIADAVDAKGVDPAVVLGQLIAIIRNVQWTTELVQTQTVWPVGFELGSAEEDWDGPWVEELSLDVRDTLATVDDAQLARLASQWARVEEFEGRADADALLSVLKDLVGLARRARGASEVALLVVCLIAALGTLPSFG